MTTIEIPEHINKDTIARYCHSNISPRRYYLHDSIGGVGWRLYSEYRKDADNWKRQHSEWRLDLYNEQHAIMLRLKYGR